MGRVTDKRHMKGRLPETICWTCEKSTGWCSWSQDLTPVGGWEAIDDPHLYGDQGKIVIRCPEYEKEKPRMSKYYSCHGCRFYVQYHTPITVNDKYFQGYCYSYRRNVGNPDIKGAGCLKWDGRRKKDVDDV